MDFVFHGYEEIDFVIKSHKDWKAFLLTKDIRIFDEGDKRISTQEFFQIINDSIGEKKHKIIFDRVGWYDQEGFAFRIEFFC